MTNKDSRLVLGTKEIHLAVKRTVNRIIQFDRTVSSKGIVLVPILNGALPFAMDVSRELFSQRNNPHTFDTICISRYSEGTTGNGATIHKNLSKNWEGYTVILLDDIYDKGITARVATELLMNPTSEVGQISPRKLMYASLFKRCTKRGLVSVTGIKYKIPSLGNPIEAYSAVAIYSDKWLFGYGMDSDGMGYRGIQTVRSVNESVKKPQ